MYLSDINLKSKQQKLRGIHDLTNYSKIGNHI